MYILSAALLIIAALVARAQGPATARPHLQRAQGFAQGGDYLGAIGEYQQALEADPGNVEGHLGLAKAYVALHDFGRAAAEFEAVLERNPGHVEATKGAGLAYGALGQPTRAVELLETVANARPGDVEVRQRLGEYYYILRRPDDALRRLQEAERLEPKNPDVVLMIARAALQARNAELAERYYRRVLQFDATQLEARRYLVDIYIAREEFSKAKALVEALIEQFPDDLPLLIELAELYQKMGQPEEAAATYEQFAERAPPDDALRVRLELARAYCAAGSFEKAEPHFEAAIKLRPEDPDLRGQLAKCLVRQAKFGEAAAQYEEALRMRPDNRALRLGLAEAYESADELLKALDQYALLAWRDASDTPALLKVASVAAAANAPERAVAALSAIGAEHPDNAEVRLALADAFTGCGDLKSALGQCHEVVRRGANLGAEWRAARLSERLGNTDAAVQHLANLHEQDPRETSHLTSLGPLLMAQGRPAEAARTLEEFLAADPDSVVVRSNLASAYLALGQPERAEELLTTLLADRPDALWAVSLLAQCYTARGRWDEATQLYAHLIEREPDRAEYYAGVIAARRQEGAPAKACEQLVGLAQSGMLTPAAARAIGAAYRELSGAGMALLQLRELEAAYPDQPALILAEAELLERLGRGQEALGRYGLYLQRQPSDAQTALRAARLAEAEGATEQEISWLAGVVAERGEDAGALMRLSQLSLLVKRPADAQVFAQRAAAATPRDPRVWRLLAEAVVRGSGSAAAVERLRAEVQERTDNAAPLIGLARALSLAGQLQEAEEKLTGLPPKVQRWSETCYVRGLLERARDRVLPATELLAQAASLQPRPEYALAAEELLSENGRGEEALWVCCQLLAAGRVQPAVVERIGALIEQDLVSPVQGCEVLRDALISGGPSGPVNRLFGTVVVPRCAEEAAEALGDVVRLYPDNETLWAPLAEATQAAGRRETAIAARQTLATLRPGDSQAQANLGLALEEAGEAQAAAEAYRRALESDPDCSAAAEGLRRVGEPVPAAEEEGVL